MKTSPFTPSRLLALQIQPVHLVLHAAGTLPPIPWIRSRQTHKRFHLRKKEDRIDFMMNRGTWNSEGYIRVMVRTLYKTWTGMELEVLREAHRKPNLMFHEKPS